MKAAKNCNKCHNKTVKESYHTVCHPCAVSLSICPKCGVSRDEWIKNGEKVMTENDGTNDNGSGDNDDGSDDSNDDDPGNDSESKPPTSKP